MKRGLLLLISIIVLAGSAAGQIDPLDPVSLGNTRILLPEPPFTEKDGVEITVEGTVRETGYAATLLSVNNLRGRITFEIAVQPIGEEHTLIGFEEWSVSARLGFLAAGTYDVVAVVNGRVTAEEQLEVPESGPGPESEAITWIKYRKSGGIAGIDRQLRVDLDTREYELLVDGEEYTGTLSLRNYLRLVSAVILCDFPDLETEYTPETPIADGFRYEVEVPGYDIVGYSGAEIPRGFSFLVGTLEDLVEKILQTEGPTPTPTPATTIFWIDYRKTGGPEGIDRAIHIDLETHEYQLEADGERHEGVLDPDAALTVDFAVIMADFPNMESEYRPETPKDDGYTYTLETPGKKVVGYSGAEVPRGLSFLVTTLDEVVDDILAIPLVPTPTPARPTPTPTPGAAATPTPTFTPTSTPTPGDVLFVTGRLDVHSETPSEFSTIRGTVTLNTPPDVFRVVSSSVSEPEDGVIHVDLTVSPVWPAPSEVPKGTSFRTFVDLGKLAPGDYEAVVSVNDIVTDRRLFHVNEAAPPFLQFEIAARGGARAVSLEISEEGRFVMTRGDSGSKADSMCGRLFPEEMDELRSVLAELPLEPLPEAGPPALEAGDTLLIHQNQMLVVESGKLPPPEVLGGVAQVGRLVNDIVVRVERATSTEAQLVVLPEADQRLDSVTFDLSGEFPASNFALVWAEAGASEERSIDLFLWSEMTGQIGAQVITPWRIQVPVTELESGEHQVRLFLNGRQIDSASFTVGRMGTRK